LPSIINSAESDMCFISWFRWNVRNSYGAKLGKNVQK
jgi:hypothetical protein